MTESVELLKRKLERERKARKQAENILEKKALELYSANEMLKDLVQDKDILMDTVSSAMATLIRDNDIQSAIQSSIDIICDSQIADRICFASVCETENDQEITINFTQSAERGSGIADFINKPGELRADFFSYCTSNVKNKQIVILDKNELNSSVIIGLFDVLKIDTLIFMPIQRNDRVTDIFVLEIVENRFNWTSFEKEILLNLAIGIESAFERDYAQKEIEERWQNLVENQPEALQISIDGKIVYLNPAGIKLYEATSMEEMIGYNIFEEATDEAKKLLNRRYLKILDQGKVEPLEIPIRTKKGNFRFIEANSTSINYNGIKAVQTILRDITERREAERKLQRESSRLTALISNLNSGILLEDAERKILVTNQTFCDIFEIPVEPSRLVGVDCTNSAKESKYLVENGDDFETGITNIVEQRKIRTNEEIYFKNGQVFERDFIPIFHKNEYLGHLWEYRDITLKKESEIELIRARVEAEASRKLKQKFLANMSHEIRTPMNGVVGIVHLLEKTSLSGEQSKYLNILKDSSEHLLHIINDILDVSKIEEGKLVLAKSSVQLELILEGVVQNLKTRAEDKKLNINLVGLNIFKSHLLTDPVRIRQILLNLLSNAIKFTHKGSIYVVCENIDESDTMQTFSISIKDTGIGIPRERLKHIFNPFDQGLTDTSNQYGGTGLGLNIVKDLVEKMNGQINVVSHVSKGSTFTITLTLEKAPKDEVVFNDEINSNYGDDILRGKTILIADDHEVNFTIAKELIHMWGGNVLYAQDGEIALNVLIQSQVDLILMDMQMPNLDGIEATKMIRLLQEPKSTTPIIAMTAAALPEERERCLQSGMNDYISKPYNPKMLLDILINHMFEEGETGEIKTPATELYESESSYDLSYLRELSANNTKFMLEMVHTFQNEMPELVNDMLVAAQEKKFSVIHHSAHKAKSMAGYIGNQKLRNQLSKIELMALDHANIHDVNHSLKEISAELTKTINELNQVTL